MGKRKKAVTFWARHGWWRHQNKNNNNRNSLYISIHIYYERRDCNDVCKTLLQWKLWTLAVALVRAFGGFALKENVKWKATRPRRPVDAKQWMHFLYTLRSLPCILTRRVQYTRIWESHCDATDCQLDGSVLRRSDQPWSWCESASRNSNDHSENYKKQGSNPFFNYYYSGGLPQGMCDKKKEHLVNACTLGWCRYCYN